MKKFLLAMSIALALVVTTSCGVKAGNDEIVVTINNDVPLLFFNDLQMYNADTDEKFGDPAKKLKLGGSVKMVAEKNSTVYFKMLGGLSGAGYHTLSFELGDADQEISFTVSNTYLDVE